MRLLLIKTRKQIPQSCCMFFFQHFEESEKRNTSMLWYLRENVFKKFFCYKKAQLDHTLLLKRFTPLKHFSIEKCSPYIVKALTKNQFYYTVEALRFSWKCRLWSCWYLCVLQRQKRSNPRYVKLNSVCNRIGEIPTQKFAAGPDTVSK